MSWSWLLLFACSKGAIDDPSAEASPGDTQAALDTADEGPPSDTGPAHDSAGDSHDSAGGGHDSGAGDSGGEADEGGGYLPSGYAPTLPARLIYMGDSITDGVGASQSALAYTSLLLDNEDHSWPDYVDLELPTLYPSLESIVDVSRSGATTHTLVSSQLANLEAQLGAEAPGETMVFVTIGGNDYQFAMYDILVNGEEAALETMAEVEENLLTMFSFFADPSRFPDGAWIYFTNVYDPTDDLGQSDDCFFGFDLSDIWPYFRDANAALQDLARREGVALVDLHGHFLGHGHNYADSSLPEHDAADLSLWFSDDCIHPNDRGHHELRRLFLHALEGEPL